MNLLAQNPRDSVSFLGESKLIASIRRWLGDTVPPAPAGIGDDCAVLPGSPRHQLVTVDPVIHGRHFDDSVPPAAVGRKLLHRNLSDIAAMGGRPRAAVLALALDARVSVRWLAAFHRGLAAAARRHGVSIVGGDVAQQASGFVATLTLIGEVDASRALTRVGAKPGDWIYVTGALGGSRLGHHHRFTPRLAEGRWLAARPEVRSMMDLSDGLAKDLHALTPPGALPALDAAAIPVSAAARRLARADGRPALHHALTDGEDYELLFTVSARAKVDAFESSWRKKFPALRLSRIGSFARKLSADHVKLDAFAGYEHLR